MLGLKYQTTRCVIQVHNSWDILDWVALDFADSKYTSWYILYIFNSISTLSVIMYAVLQMFKWSFKLGKLIIFLQEKWSVNFILHAETTMFSTIGAKLLYMEYVCF